MATSAASVIDLTEGSPVCKRQRLDHVQAGGTVIERCLTCATPLASRC